MKPTYEEIQASVFCNKIREIERVIDNNLDEILETNKKGVYIIGSEVINNSNKPKLKGLSFEMLDKVTPYFDIIIIL